MKIGFQGIAGYAYGLIQPSAVMIFDIKQPHNSALEAQYFTSLDIADDVSDGDRKKLARMLVSVAPGIESSTPVP